LNLKAREPALKQRSDSATQQHPATFPWPQPDVVPFAQLPPAQLQWRDRWPHLDELNAALQRACRDAGITRNLEFVWQDSTVEADGLSFEQRIGASGRIATRVENLHDYYSALMWLRFPRIKCAINELHCRGIAEHGTKQRSRHQQAITHLDEAGAFVASADDAVLAALDAHDWVRAFFELSHAWQSKVDTRLFGHAVFELLHQPHLLMACKVIVVQVDADYFALSAAERDQFLDARIAPALLASEQAADPKGLATVPVSGIPGWTTQTQDEDFYRSAPCFRAKPPGRVYQTWLNARR
jgi:hypothetical protein